MAEDVRQPPYLCPVCLEKIAYAIAFELERRSQEGKEAYIKERYQAIAEFCETWKQVGLFAGYGGWVQARLEHLSV
jgi:archaemetzincin